MFATKDLQERVWHRRKLLGAGKSCPHILTNNIFPCSPPEKLFPEGIQRLVHKMGVVECYSNYTSSAYRIPGISGISKIPVTSSTSRRNARCEKGAFVFGEVMIGEIGVSGVIGVTDMAFLGKNLMCPIFHCLWSVRI